MPKTIIDVDLISQLEPTLYEEESYGFLAENYFGDWHIYDSDILGIEATKALANNFMAFHGTTTFPNKNIFFDQFWTPIPLGIFRYKMLHNGLPYLVDSYKNIDGYIVEGVYWTNGFVYIVTDQKTILQIKLFIDKKTKDIQLYPDPE
jgi:hypothetical protein